MRRIILGCLLAVAACGKPAENKKVDKVEKAPERPGAEVVTPAAPAVPDPASPEEKARVVAKLEEKISFLDQQAAKVTEDMASAASERERDALAGKLEHLAEEKAALRREIEAAQR